MRVVLRGHQRLPRCRRPTVWIPAAADDAQSAPLRLGEQCVLRMRERRPNTIAAVVPAAIRRSQNSTAARWANSGSANRDSDGKMHRFEPLEQLSAAVGIPGEGLREMDVGVDESGQHEAGPVVVKPAADSWAAGISVRSPQ